MIGLGLFADVSHISSRSGCCTLSINTPFSGERPPLFFRLIAITLMKFNRWADTNVLRPTPKSPGVQCGGGLGYLLIYIENLIFHSSFPVHTFDGRLADDLSSCIKVVGMSLRPDRSCRLKFMYVYHQARPCVMGQRMCVLYVMKFLLPSLLLKPERLRL